MLAVANRRTIWTLLAIWVDTLPLGCGAMATGCSLKANSYPIYFPHMDEQSRP